jgi:peptidoglycan/xylan/chitin deacetylase (PgdA/CDA1 family)
MSAADIRRLLSNCISVGAHGCTHQLLTSLSPAARMEEIRRSRVEAEALSGLPVTGFTYPHGDRDAETIDMVRQAGYCWACSTCATIIDPLTANLHDLPRLQVGDWRAATLLVRLGASAHDYARGENRSSFPILF